MQTIRTMPWRDRIVLIGVSLGSVAALFLTVWLLGSLFGSEPSRNWIIGVGLVGFGLTIAGALILVRDHLVPSMGARGIWDERALGLRHGDRLLQIAAWFKELGTPPPVSEQVSIALHHNIADSLRAIAEVSHRDAQDTFNTEMAGLSRRLTAAAVGFALVASGTFCQALAFWWLRPIG